MTYPKSVQLTEVGPRDGLQNEKQPITAETKIALCQQLLAAGVSQLEVTSFVSPKWIPQLADAAEVIAAVPASPQIIRSVLVPNMKGMERALAAGVDEVVIFGAASEAFSQRNTNCSIAQIVERGRPVVAAALNNGIRVRAAVSVAFGCPYQGEVPVADVVDLTSRFKDLGVHEVGICDTIGVATANRVKSVFEATAKVFALDQQSGHFHDTYAQGVSNVLAALDVGVTRFDTSIAGLGGCPYAKGATGNVATEDVVYLLHGLGIETGLDLDKLVTTGQWISSVLGRKSNSRAGNAIAAQHSEQATA
ncbi:MAG: hydroxymethylglutaryl-CoA lyase [Burkholderiaceae bacterium]